MAGLVAAFLDALFRSHWGTPWNTPSPGFCWDCGSGEEAGWGKALLHWPDFVFSLRDKMRVGSLVQSEGEGGCQVEGGDPQPCLRGTEWLSWGQAGVLTPHALGSPVHGARGLSKVSVRKQGQCVQS